MPGSILLRTYARMEGYGREKVSAVCTAAGVRTTYVYTAISRNPTNIEIGYWAKVTQGRIGSERGTKGKRGHTRPSSNSRVSDFIRVIDELL
jgi:hypothetical protein